MPVKKAPAKKAAAKKAPEKRSIATIERPSAESATARFFQQVDKPRKDTVAQVRLDPDLDLRLEQFVQLAQKHGARSVTRSSVIRTALGSYLDAADEAIKENS